MTPRDVLAVCNAPCVEICNPFGATSPEETKELRLHSRRCPAFMVFNGQLAPLQLPEIEERIAIMRGNFPVAVVTRCGTCWKGGPYD